MSTNLNGFSDPQYDLEERLARIAESIQLDITRQKRMESAYEAVEKMLDNDKEFFSGIDFEIYPQGSVKIGTTVKPIEGNEFDLDIVIHIVADWRRYSSSQIYAELKRVLQSDERYKDKLEYKNRCIRINYAGDFHMDILPGIQENAYDKNRIVIPDRELKKWTTSNPRGYAQWFIDKASSVKQILLEKAMSVEALEMEEFAKKKPLTRAVQLLKLYRDEYFKNDRDKATSSIILTTIAAQYYNGEESIYRTVQNTIYKINTNSMSSRLKIVNPMNPQEDFTEKWDTNPELYLAFLKFARNLNVEWAKMTNQNEEENGKSLRKLFSENAYNKADMAHRDYFSRQESIKSKKFESLKILAKTQSPSQKPYIEYDK